MSAFYVMQSIDPLEEYRRVFVAIPEIPDGAKLIQWVISPTVSMPTWLDYSTSSEHPEQFSLIFKGPEGSDAALTSDPAPFLLTMQGLAQYTVLQRNAGLVVQKAVNATLFAELHIELHIVKQLAERKDVLVQSFSISSADGKNVFSNTARQIPSLSIEPLDSVILSCGTIGSTR